MLYPFTDNEYHRGGAKLQDIQETVCFFCRTVEPYDFSYTELK